MVDNGASVVACLQLFLWLDEAHKEWVKTNHDQKVNKLTRKYHQRLPLTATYNDQPWSNIIAVGSYLISILHNVHHT